MVEVCNCLSNMLWLEVLKLGPKLLWNVCESFFVSWGATLRPWAAWSGGGCSCPRHGRSWGSLPAQTIPWFCEWLLDVNWLGVSDNKVCLWGEKSLGQVQPGAGSTWRGWMQHSLKPSLLIAVPPCPFRAGANSCQGARLAPAGGKEGKGKWGAEEPACPKCSRTKGWLHHSPLGCLVGFCPGVPNGPPECFTPSRGSVIRFRVL